MSRGGRCRYLLHHSVFVYVCCTLSTLSIICAAGFPRALYIWGEEKKPHKWVTLTSLFSSVLRVFLWDWVGLARERRTQGAWAEGPEECSSGEDLLPHQSSGVNEGSLPWGASAPQGAWCTCPLLVPHTAFVQRQIQWKSPFWFSPSFSLVKEPATVW